MAKKKIHSKNGNQEILIEKELRRSLRTPWEAMTENERFRWAHDEEKAIENNYKKLVELSKNEDFKNVNRAKNFFAYANNLLSFYDFGMLEALEQGSYTSERPIKNIYNTVCEYLNKNCKEVMGLALNNQYILSHLTKTAKNRKNILLGSSLKGISVESLSFLLQDTVLSPAEEAKVMQKQAKLFQMEQVKERYDEMRKDVFLNGTTDEASIAWTCSESTKAGVVDCFQARLKRRGLDSLYLSNLTKSEQKYIEETAENLAKALLINLPKDENGRQSGDLRKTAFNGIERIYCEIIPMILFLSTPMSAQEIYNYMAPKYEDVVKLYYPELPFAYDAIFEMAYCLTMAQDYKEELSKISSYIKLLSLDVKEALPELKDKSSEDILVKMTEIFHNYSPAFDSQLQIYENTATKSRDDLLEVIEQTAYLGLNKEIDNIYWFGKRLYEKSNSNTPELNDMIYNGEMAGVKLETGTFGQINYFNNLQLLVEALQADYEENYVEWEA